ncbi:MAG: DUF2059 domain-containing protein [Oceanicaulis sp.]
MKKLAISLLGAVLMAGAVYAQTDDLSEREALALEMIELSGAADMANTMVDQMLPMMEPSFRQGYPNATDAQIAEALSIFAQAFRDRNEQMNHQMAELHTDMLSADDMRAINAFYRSEAGENLLAAMPEVMERSQAIGERMAMEIMSVEGPAMEAALTDAAPAE